MKKCMSHLVTCGGERVKEGRHVTRKRGGGWRGERGKLLGF